MSNEATSWAARQTTGRTGRKATLLVVANVCDARGVTYAGVDYLAGVMECGRDTVISNLQKLEADEHLLRIRRWNKVDGSPTSSLIVLGALRKDRGDMHPAVEHPEYRNLITKAIAEAQEAKANAQDETSESEPKSENPTSDSSPAQVGKNPGPSRKTRPNTSPDTSGDTVVSRERDDLPAIRDALVSAGFDRMVVEQYDAAIGLALGELVVPDDVDWHRTGMAILRARESGALRSDRPDGALRFIAKGFNGFPRLRAGDVAAPTDRPSWDDAARMLRAAVAEHGRDALGALRALAAHHQPVAQFVAEVGWQQWCDRPANAGWLGHCRRTYEAMTLDPRPALDLIAQLEHNAAMRAALDAGTNPYAPEVSE